MRVEEVLDRETETHGHQHPSHAPCSITVFNTPPLPHSHSPCTTLAATYQCVGTLHPASQLVLLISPKWNNDGIGAPEIT